VLKGAIIRITFFPFHKCTKRSQSPDH